MGKWYDKIFIGNPNKEDFTAKDLPKNRREQFWDVVKLHFLDMVKGNIIYAAFAIPLMIWALFYWYSITVLKEQEAMEILRQGDTVLSFLIFCVPLYTIMGPAKAGLHYCLRNWAWNERATVGEHFWKEFKRSFWKSLCLNLINAMVLFAGVWWTSMLSLAGDEHPALRIVAVVVMVLVIAYFMSSIYHFPQLVTYNLSIVQILKNSFIYLVAQFPRTLLAVIIYAALAVICYVLRQALLVVALTLGMSFVFLGQTVYSNYLFDKYVNAPSEQRKGMAPLEK